MSRNPYSWKYFLNDYFIFSKGQRRAVIILGLGILVAIVFPYGYALYYEKKEGKISPFIINEITSLKVADSLANNYKNNQANSNPESFVLHKNEVGIKSAALFFFDPNTASSEKWKQLGIREKTIETIIKYRSKGGQFRKAEDLEKIYGLRPFEIERLKPYVKINETQFQAKTREESYTSKPGINKEKSIGIIDINIADTTAFKSLPAIGSKLAQRIINYREALGGFISVKQVAEVYGIPDSTYRKIEKFLMIKNVSTRKKNINTASVNDLRMPYLPGNVAKAIVQYRDKNGLFSTTADLKKIPIVDEDLFVKIEPYLTIK
jgi:DNA uptake protein ComE-like DNA-binding protein